MSIPAVFDPVTMAIPQTGRQVNLVDGGTLENLPIGYNKDDLPTIGLSLLEPGKQSAASSDNTSKVKTLPSGNLDTGNVISNAITGLDLLHKGGRPGTDFDERSDPKANQFMLSLPTWDLTNTGKRDSVLRFGYDKKVDPAIDQQTRSITEKFFASYLDKLSVQGASGTNIDTKLPADLSFSTAVQARGQTYQAQYDGGDNVTFVSSKGKKVKLKIGHEKIAGMMIDQLSFGDLSAQLGNALESHFKLDPFAAL